jgi:hypothetical protein
MKPTFIIIFFLLSHIIIAQNSVSEKLIASIEEDNSEMYIQTLDYWLESIPCWANDTLKSNKLLNDLNDIIILFYSNDNSDLIRESSHWGKEFDFNLTKNYLLFKSSIPVSFTNSTFNFDTLNFFSNLKIELKDSLGISDLYHYSKWAYFSDSLSIIKSFPHFDLKPQLKIEEKNILFMTKSLELEISDYLKKIINENTQEGTVLYSTISNINPEILNLTFNQEHGNCLIEFRIIDRGGYMITKKTDKVWKILESEIIWIQ